jgi:hypothetical protein
MAVSKTIRFEVFKRDKFTCQYCGRKSPEVILQIEHVVPKSNGGLDDPMNLVAACFDCNSGKSDRPLSDDSVLEKRRAQTELLEDKRQQIEMIAEWQLELSYLDVVGVDKVCNLVNVMTERVVNECGRAELKTLITKNGFLNVIEATRECCNSGCNLDRFTTEVTAILEKKSKKANLEKAIREKPVQTTLNYCYKILSSKRGSFDWCQWRELTKRVDTIEMANTLVMLAKNVTDKLSFFETSGTMLDADVDEAQWRNFQEYENEPIRCHHA